MEEEDNDRLAKMEKLLEKKDRKGNRLCWIRWDPNSKYGYEIEDAREEIRWMVYEIRRLKEENAELKSFVDNFRLALETEMNEE
ncbi:MAG: hypothetical protein P1P77_05700 [Spirochaetaceae bacterium]|nr:hypothetical protein [Spirochaetaceae bacterium]